MIKVPASELEPIREEHAVTTGSSNTTSPPPGARPRRASLLADWATACVRWLRPRSADWALMVVVVGCALLIRVARAEPIEIGGDAVSKWYFVRQWFHGVDLTTLHWDHHKTRMGVNVPIAIAQLLSGRTGGAYYAAPLAAVAVQVGAVFWTGRLLHARATGVLAALLVMLFTPMDRAGSQLLPEVFGGAYMALVMLTLVGYARARDRSRTVFLVLVALLSFFAYESKEPFVFFFPGIAAAIWLTGARLRHVLLFMAILAAGFLLETAAYNVFLGRAHRFAVVTSTHGAGVGLVLSSAWQLLDRFVKAEPPWPYYFAFFSAACFGLPALTRRREVLMTLLPPLSYYFLFAVAVRRVNPIEVWTRFLSRYLDVGIPLLALCIALFFAMSFSRAWRFMAPRVVRRWRGRLPAPLGPALLAAFMIVLTWYVVPRDIFQNNAIQRANQYARIASRAVQERVPLGRRGRTSDKAVRAVLAVYTRDKALTEFVHTPFEELPKVVRARNPPAPLPAGCHVELVTKARFLRVQVPSSLPEGCPLQGI